MSKKNPCLYVTYYGKSVNRKLEDDLADKIKEKFGTKVREAETGFDLTTGGHDIGYNVTQSLALPEVMEFIRRFMENQGIKFAVEEAER
jgi:hypothetical protein